KKQPAGWNLGSDLDRGDGVDLGHPLVELAVPARGRPDRRIVERPVPRGFLYGYGRGLVAGQKDDYPRLAPAVATAAPVAGLAGLISAGAPATNGEPDDYEPG